jgi:ATP-binding cassette subfamily D (ALD) long-chain fatty acid import protein
LLLSLADAGGRLMYAYKDLLELAGLTTRLYTLLSTLLNMPPGHVPIAVERAEAVSLRGVDVWIPRFVRGSTGMAKGKQKENGPASHDEEADWGKEKERDDDPPLVKDLNLSIERGEHMMITGSNGVGKTSVARVLAGLWDPVASGAGEGAGAVEMPRDETEAGVLLRCGHRASAGQGNESGERPGSAYTTSTPGHPRPRPTLYVVPQRSYMVTGSLLEQIIYPCSYASFVRLSSSSSSSSGSSNANTARPAFSPRSSSHNHNHNPVVEVEEPSEEALAEIHGILDKVYLGYLAAREGGLHVRKEWRDVLSGGEKQRVGIARVLWWRPKFAVLDGTLSRVFFFLSFFCDSFVRSFFSCFYLECTSAVSSDVEGRMYEALKALDITLITISLRFVSSLSIHCLHIDVLFFSGSFFSLCLFFLIFTSAGRSS